MHVNTADSSAYPSNTGTSLLEYGGGRTPPDEKTDEAQSALQWDFDQLVLQYLDRLYIYMYSHTHTNIYTAGPSTAGPTIYIYYFNAQTLPMKVKTLLTDA
jgi:hypothetical protein